MNACWLSDGLHSSKMKNLYRATSHESQQKQSSYVAVILFHKKDFLINSLLNDVHDALFWGCLQVEAGFMPCLKPVSYLIVIP